MAQLPDYCTVDGEDLGRLATAIGNAFDADELDELVRITFSEGLYQSYVGRDLRASIHDEDLATRRFSMMRIMARWMKAATVLA
jgi:hypothetical protein